MVYRTAEAVHEQWAIGQSGQGVVEGVVEQLLLGQFPTRNIAVRAGHAVGLARLVANSNAPVERPAVGSVLVKDTVFALKVGRSTLEVCGYLVS